MTKAEKEIQVGNKRENNTASQNKQIFITTSTRLTEKETCNYDRCNRKESKNDVYANQKENKRRY